MLFSFTSANITLYLLRKNTSMNEGFHFIHKLKTSRYNSLDISKKKAIKKLHGGGRGWLRPFPALPPHTLHRPPSEKFLFLPAEGSIHNTEYKKAVCPIPSLLTAGGEGAGFFEAAFYLYIYL